MRHIQTLNFSYKNLKAHPSIDLRETKTPISFKSKIYSVDPKVLGEELIEGIEESKYFWQHIPDGVSISLPKGTLQASIEVYAGKPCSLFNQKTTDKERYLWASSTQAFEFPLILSLEDLFTVDTFQVGISQSKSKDLSATIELSTSLLRNATGIKRYQKGQDLGIEGSNEYQVIFEAYHLNEKIVKGRLSFIAGNHLSFTKRQDSDFLMGTSKN